MFGPARGGHRGPSVRAYFKVPDPIEWDQGGKGVNTADRVELMARHVPSQVGNETSEAFDTGFFCTALLLVYQNLNIR